MDSLELEKQRMRSLLMSKDKSNIRKLIRIYDFLRYKK